MKLEYGKRYVTRSGEVTGTLYEYSNPKFPFKGLFKGGTKLWKEDGSYSHSPNRKHEYDLVKEYVKEPATDPQPGLTKREFMQQFVLDCINGTSRKPNEVVDYVEKLWDLIEEKCK